MALSVSEEQAVIHTSDSVIKVDGLVKRYKGGTQALRDFALEIRAGELFGLVGPDGAGKTSVLKILAGIMEPTSGTAKVLGKKPSDARRNVGYVPQGGALYPELSIDENLKYEAGMHGVSDSDYRKLRELHLKNMGLLQFADRLAGQLSGGMKQKLALCCALVSQPQVILLDEPTTGLDPISRRELWQALAVLGKEGVTAVVATPFLDEAERCNRVALMYEGSVQELGSPAELQAALNLTRVEIVVGNDADSLRGLGTLAVERSDNITDIWTFGDHIEVLCKEPRGAVDLVSQALKNAQIEIKHIHEGAPNLENVFVTKLRSLGQKEGHSVPFPHIRREGSPPGQNGATAMKATGLFKKFGNFVAVDNVDLELKHGEIFGLLGANGAGKTTTIKMLCGLLRPSSGSVMLGGETSNLRSKKLRKRIGYMSQKFTLYDNLTVRENLEFYAAIYEIPLNLRKQQIDWVIKACELEEIQKSLVKSLPLGWKQRIAFGAAVMHEPDIIFLDEPTAGVDPLARRQLWKLIREFAANGAVILVTTHYLDEAEYCSRMAFMASSRIVAQGSPQELRQLPKGDLVEIKADDTQNGFQILSSQLDHWRVAIFGSFLHVILDNADSDLPGVQKLLLDGGCKVTSSRKIPFSLEDAFIDVVQHQGRRAS